MIAFREHTVAWTIALALADASAIVGAYAFSSFLSLRPGEIFLDQIIANSSYLGVMAGVWAYQAIEQRLFTSMRSDALMPQLFAVTKTAVITGLLTVFLIALLVEAYLDRSLLIIFCATTLLNIVIVRIGLRLSLWGLRRRGYNYRRILVIGSNERAADVVQVIQSHEHFGYQIEGFLEDDPGRHWHLKSLGIDHLGEIRDLEEVLVKKVIDVVYICLPLRSFYETIRSIAHLCEGVGAPVRLMADLFPFRAAGSELTRIGRFPMLSLATSGPTRTPLHVQRITDALVAALLLVLLSPFFAIISVLIKLDSKGPVLVRERRDGPFGRKEVNVIRFRTSRAYGSGTTPSLPDHAAAGDSQSADTNGLTRVGRFLRKYRLDELPILINIGRGQMSLSDPRTLGSPIEEHPRSPEEIAAVNDSIDTGTHSGRA